jgi:hypothetical protein
MSKFEVLQDPHEERMFFEQYQSAFEQKNWPAFASLFYEPAISVRADGCVMNIPTHSEGVRLYAGVSESWQAEGYARFDIQDFQVFRMGGDSRLVSFLWLMLRENGSLIRCWHQSYQLIRTAQGWRVLASTFHKN